MRPACVVSALYIYPLKSAAGIAVDSARLDAFGLAGDRRWMVVDETDTFVTQRTVPRLALVHTLLSGDSLTLAAPDGGRFTLEPSTERRQVSVWKSTMQACDAGDDA